MKDRIKTLRKELGLNQTDFGSKIGATQAMITSYETGRVVPDDSMRILICREFGVRREWLETGNKPKYQKDLSASDSDLSVVLRAMSGKNESKKQLLRIIADMPDELLDAFVAYLQTKKEPPQA